MTGCSVTFRQEPKHDLSGGWVDVPLLVMSQAWASGPRQTSGTHSSLPRDSKKRMLRARQRGRQPSILCSAHCFYGKLVRKIKADKCGQEISRQPLKRAFGTSGPAFTSSYRSVNGQQQTWQAAWDPRVAHWDWMGFCVPRSLGCPLCPVCRPKPRVCCPESQALLTQLINDSVLRTTQLLFSRAWHFQAEFSFPTFCLILTPEALPLRDLLTHPNSSPR